MDKLLNAAVSADIAGDVEVKESKINAVKFSRIIAQVYSAACIDFRGVSEEDIKARADELMNEERIVKPFLRKGITHDVVSLREALIWTGYKVVTGVSKRIRFTLTVDPETASKNQDMKKIDSVIWSSFIVGDKESDTYELSVLGEIYKFEILGNSVGTYEVSLREVHNERND